MNIQTAIFGRARLVIAALVMIALAGTSAFLTIPKESDPDVNIPILYVSVQHEGISPEDAERLIVKPLEEKLRGIEGKKEMRAKGYDGGAFVILEFEAGFDADTALKDVREKVDEARPDLPADSEEPAVHEVNLSLFPILVVTLSGNLPERTLLRLARDLRDRVEAIPEVLKAEIAGDREEVVEVLIDPLRIESYGVSGDDVVAAVGRSNLLIAAGALDAGQGRFTVRVPGLFETVADIMQMPLKVAGDATVRVGDVATLHRTFKDPEGFARVNGRTAIALEVSKRTGRNIIDTIAEVRRVVEAERAYWPAAVQVEYLQDRSTDIRGMLSDLRNNLIAGGVLVMVVIVGALGLSSGALVGIAIPGSFLMAILVLQAMGLTVNIVVLFSLILAVGMLVDAAIVVTEYADRRMMEGADRRRAFGEAAGRMFWPITSSTLTTLAAFLPLLFWPGVVGEFMKYLPITLLATLTASLLMALLFVPTLGAQFGRPGEADPRALHALAQAETGDIRALGGGTGFYVRVLGAALRHPGKVLAATVLVMVGVQLGFARYGAGVEFFPDVEPERAVVHVHARGNLSIWEKDALVREVEQRVLAIGRERGEFRSVYARTGTPEQVTEEAEDIVGKVQLEFAAWNHRRKASAIFAEIAARTRDLAGIHVEPRKEEAGPPVGKPIQVQLSSRFPETLPEAVARVRARFDQTAGLVGVEDSRPLPGIDWHLTVDRAQAAKFGADVTNVGNALKLVTNGLKLGGYRPNDADEEIDIVARYPAPYRTIEQLDRVRVVTAAGAIPVSSMVRRSAAPTIGTVARVDGRRVMTVQADVADGVLVDDKARDIAAWLAREANLDPRVQVEMKGEDKEQREAQAFLQKAFLAALFLIAVILIAQFNSFYSSALVLSAIVLSTIGVMIGHLITQQPFGIVMSGIGVIALAGIVVNNNIVLIDTFDQLKRTEPSVELAILRTGAQRLRPVLLTSVTTVLGLIPMMFGLNIDFVTREVTVGAPSTQWWMQLATAIAFGLTFATVLTLLVTPAALMLKARLAARFRRRRPAAPAAAADPDAPLKEAAE